MSELVKDVNDANFQSEVSSGVVLVDFWAPWCGPCRMQGPILDQVAQHMQGRAKIIKVNVDEAPETAGRFGIRSIPTLAVFRDGKAGSGFLGVQQANVLIGALDKALADATPVAS